MILGRMWRRAPRELCSELFVLEPLGPQHNDADFAAWSTTIEHIRATPGFRAEHWGGDEWPYPMTSAANLVDLTTHAEEFERAEALERTMRDWLSSPEWGFNHVRFPGRDAL